jgi:hypothetical protein
LGEFLRRNRIRPSLAAPPVGTGPRTLLPAFLREELLAGATRSNRRDGHLAPLAFFVLATLEDHADDPRNAHALYVGQFLDVVMGWFRDARGGRSSPTPSEPELAAVFGDDWRVVQQIWPALAALSDERVSKRDKTMGDRLAIFVLQAGELVGSSAVANIVRAHLAGRNGEDVDDTIAKVHTWLQRRPDRFAGMRAEQGAQSVVSYVWRSITSFASDSLRVAVPTFDAGAAAWLPDRELQVSARTRRRHREQGATTPAEFGQSLADARKRQSHQGTEGKTLPEVASHLGWPARTIGKTVAEIERALGQPAPRSGRYLRLTGHWVELVRAELLRKKPRPERRRDEPDA